VQVLGKERSGEAWPASAAVEFCATPEQGQAAQPAGVQSVAFLVHEHTAKWRFLAVIEEEMTLFFAEASRERTKLPLIWWREIEGWCRSTHGTVPQQPRSLLHDPAIIQWYVLPVASFPNGSGAEIAECLLWVESGH
jgi:hypothetical protein